LSSKRASTARAASGTTDTSQSGPAKALTASHDANRISVMNSTSPWLALRKSSSPSSPAIALLRMPGKIAALMSSS